MKYLTSIELLRRVSKQLSVGKRDLPPVSQLKSMEVILSQVHQETLGVLEMTDVQVTLESLMEALQEIRNLAALPLKDSMIETLIKGDFAACNELSAQLPALDRQKFDALMAVEDRTRLIRLISETQTITSIPPSMQETLMKGVNTVMGRFCSTAFNYYKLNHFEPTDKVIDVMRHVVAVYYGVTEFV